jgi:predicted dienelactone hydrolase
MLESWADHDKLDPNRVGFYGFSRGGYTGLVAIGGNPDIRKGIALCPKASRLPYCQSIRKNEIPTQAPTHDGRIKAAVLADPAFGVLFDADGLKNIKAPVQLWASTHSGNCIDIDGVCPRSVASLDRNLPSKPDYHVIANAGHLAFVAPCTPELAKVVPAICVDEPGFDRVLFHKEFNADVIAFFRKHLHEP